MRWPVLALCSSIVLSAALAGGCEGDSTPAPKAATPAPAGADAVVGYDLRRLRPRDGETLAAMYDRMAAATKADGKRVAMLFSADWCEPCRRLELELGNAHPEAKIGGFRILELKEEDWEAATRMNEFNELRKRWYAPKGSYPVFIVLDENGEKVEEMKEAIARLEAAQIEPTVDNWFENVSQGRSAAAG